MEKQLSFDFEIPKGYEIDVANSCLEKGRIKFKTRDLTYQDVARKLFYGKYPWYVAKSCVPKQSAVTADGVSYLSGMLSSNKNQTASMLSLNMLANVAAYLNGDWRPRKIGDKYMIGLGQSQMGHNPIKVISHTTVMYSCVYFKTADLAYKAIKILGEECIKQSLSINT